MEFLQKLGKINNNSFGEESYFLRPAVYEQRGLIGRRRDLSEIFVGVTKGKVMHTPGTRDNP